MISPHVPPLNPPEPGSRGSVEPITPIYLAGVGLRPYEPGAGADGPEPGEAEAAEQRDFFEEEPGTDEGSLPWPQTLADIMSQPVLTARTGQSVREVVQLLAHRRIAGVPVVDDDGRLAGVLSQSDVAAHVAQSWAEVAASREAGPFFQSLWITDPNMHERVSADTPVEQVMAPYVYYATPDTTLDEAADLLLAHGIHRVIVLRGQEIAGIVTSLDLLRAYRQR